MSETPVLDRRHGRVPQQSRSRATLARVAEAAEALFGERGYDGTTVGDIVSRAGCSVGAFYARFNDKEALLRHVHDRQCRLLIERIEFVCDLMKAENANLDAAVRQAVRALFQFGAGRRALTRVFIQKSGADPEFHMRYALAWAEVRSRLRPALLARRREIARQDPEAAIDFVLQLMHSAWANDVLHHGVNEVTGQSSGARLVDELADACLAYLRAPSPGR